MKIVPQALTLKFSKKRIKFPLYLLVNKVFLNLSVINDLRWNLICLDLVLKAHSLPTIRKGNEEIAYNFIDSRLASELAKVFSDKVGAAQSKHGARETGCLESEILASPVASGI